MGRIRWQYWQIFALRRMSAAQLGHPRRDCCMSHDCVGSKDLSQPMQPFQAANTALPIQAIIARITIDGALVFTVPPCPLCWYAVWLKLCSTLAGHHASAQAQMLVLSPAARWRLRWVGPDPQSIGLLHHLNCSIAWAACQRIWLISSRYSREGQ
jgi:hypothetical protein